MPLAKRGLYQLGPEGFYTLASLIGPVIAGALGQGRLWRIYFLILLPLCAICAVIAIAFVRLPAPTQKWSSFKKIDWIGNAWIVGAVASLAIGLVPAGSQYSWSSSRVLVPLTIGVVALALWPVYERRVANPTLPRGIFANRTTVCGFIGSFISKFLSGAQSTFIVLYFQGALGQSVRVSGISQLSYGFVAQLALVFSAVYIYLRQGYRSLLVFGFAVAIPGYAGAAALTSSSPVYVWIWPIAVMSIGSNLTFLSLWFAR